MDSTTHSPNELMRAVTSVLTPELLKPRYRTWHSPANPTAGHCYVASEALYHLLESRDWCPRWAPDGDHTHWWVQHVHSGEILDPTAHQYTVHGLTPPYGDGRGCGFLTRQPSKRALVLLHRVLAL